MENLPYFLSIMKNLLYLTLRLDCHAQREGEDDVKKHNHYDGDGKPDHEVLIALDLFSEGVEAAVEVVAVSSAVIIGIGLTTSLDKVDIIK